MKKFYDDSTDEPMVQLRQLSGVKPPPALVARVMQEVEKPAPFNLWDWLRTSQRVQLRLSPLGACTAAGAMAVVIVLGASTRPQPLATAPHVSAPQPSAQRQVLVRFVIHVQGAREVAVAGDFNGWDPAAAPLQALAEPDVFAVTLPLKTGETYNYKFLVDGKWIEDPAAEARPDGFGARNSILRL